MGKIGKQCSQGLTVTNISCTTWRRKKGFAATGSRLSVFPGGMEMLKFCNTAVERINISIRARPSPTHWRLPVGKEISIKSNHYLYGISVNNLMVFVELLMQKLFICKRGNTSCKDHSSVG